MVVAVMDHVQASTGKEWYAPRAKKAYLEGVLENWLRVHVIEGSKGLLGRV